MPQINTFNDTNGDVNDFYIDPVTQVRWTIVGKSQDNKNVWENNKQQGDSDLSEKIDENCQDILVLQQNISTLQSLYAALLAAPESKVICRPTSTVQNQPPTNGVIDPEFASPVDGDTAMIILGNGITEYWEYDSSWTRTKSQQFGGANSFDPTNLQNQIDIINQWIQSNSNQSSSSFFCRVGSPTTNTPPSSTETGLSSSPPLGFQFMIIQPDDTIQIWQYTTNQWELKQTIDFASIAEQLMLRTQVCRTNSLTNVAPTLSETGATPSAGYIFVVYLSNGTQEIWQYTGTGWVIKNSIVPVIGGDADIGEGEVSKNSGTGVISITGTTTDGVSNTVTISPSDFSLFRNVQACIDELRFCNVPTGITFPVALEDAFAVQDIGAADTTLIKDCGLVYDCESGSYYRKINNNMVIVSGQVTVNRYFGTMDAREFACKLEDNGIQYCNNYVQTFDFTKDNCVVFCITNALSIDWLAITTEDGSGFTIDYGDGNPVSYDSGDTPSHTWATPYNGSIKFTFDKCLLNIAIGTTMASGNFEEINSNCHC